MLQGIRPILVMIIMLMCGTVATHIDRVSAAGPAPKSEWHTLNNRVIQRGVINNAALNQELIAGLAKQSGVTATLSVDRPNSGLTNVASPSSLPSAADIPTCLSEDFTYMPGSSWHIINNSNPVGTASWCHGNRNIFPAQAGEPDSYIVGNFNATGSVGDINLWMLTPEVKIANGSVLTFYTRKTTPNQFDFPDRLQVRLSTEGSSINVGNDSTSVGDFKTLLVDINPTLVVGGYPYAWQQYTVTLTEIVAPTTGRLAFRYVVPNGGNHGANSDYIGIDTFSFCTPQLEQSTNIYLPLIQH